MALFANKRRRFALVVIVHLIALTIAWWNLGRIYPDSAHSFMDSSATSLLLGFMSLPLSAAHFLTNGGEHGIISVAGRPHLLLTELVVSFLSFVAFIRFVTKDQRWLGILASIYLLIAAPYWAFYSYGLFGI